MVDLNYTGRIWTQTCSNTIIKWATLPQHRTRNLFWYTWRRKKVCYRIIRRPYFRKRLWKKLNPLTSLVLSLNSWANTKSFVYWMSFLSTELIDSWCDLRRYGSIGMFRSQDFHFQTKRFSGYEFGSTDRAVNSAALVSHISADANTKVDQKFESVWNWNWRPFNVEFVGDNRHKESNVAIPPKNIITDRWKGRRPVKRTLEEKIWQTNSKFPLSTALKINEFLCA